MSYGDPVEQRPNRPWVTGLIIAGLLGLVMMWVYAFGFASKDGLYRVDDDAWRDNARTVCAAAQRQRVQLADIEAGYIEEPTEQQMLQRADLVDEATDILEAMLDDVVAFPVTAERDIELVAEFEGHYRTLLGDRRAYVADLRNFIVRPYEETIVEGGGPVTNVITDFTSGNDIKPCAPPGELGGDI